MRKLLLLAIALVSIAYPLIVYFGIQSLAPGFFAVLLAAIAVAKFLSSTGRSETISIVLLVLGIGYSIALAALNSELMLRLYPVVMSWTFAGLFAFSLREDESLIERFARLSGKVITHNAKRYTRVLSGLWALLLLINGCVALYLSLFAPLSAWALYCGLISYLVMGAFFVAELLYRPLYIRKYGV